MKEFLDPTDNYKFHKIPIGDAPHWMIEIPDGADVLLRLNSGLSAFYKDNFKKVWNLGIWCSTSNAENLKDKCRLWERKSMKEYIDESEIISEEMKSLDDKVNQPNHYANFSIECIDAMQAMLSREEFIGYLRGNIFKYLWRYKLKNGVEDLKKAQWYQNKLIEVEENE